MKKPALLLAALAAAATAFSQNEKGANPLPSAVQRPPSAVTRAVVVGISDYHDPAIADLQFADRDARAFADWLKSPAGGSVAEDNIQLLTNEHATNAQIGLALYWLVDSCRAGETAIIYFSGHGDLDSKKLRDQWGYLLTYDTPSKIYSAGAYPLNYLQNVVSTLSLDQQVRVELFLDACHVGKLAGEAIGGGQATAQSLARQFANEVKILSCQPNEFSLEGRQWGGGRGCFSHNLIEGMTGLADRNNDGTVTLHEIDRYLGDIVPTETAPQPQTPFTVGDRNFALARVDAPALARLREAKSTAVANASPVGMKGLEDEVLARADTAARRDYRSFKHALKTGELLEPEGASADTYFSRLIGNEVFRPLAGLMRRNLAAALADGAQEALNAILSDEPFEINVWTSAPGKYKLYPAYLQRALELIGENNYLHRALLAKKLYFEGYNLYKNCGSIDPRKDVRDSCRSRAKQLFLQCLELEPDAAYACYSIGDLVEKTGNRALGDSNITWLKRAVELAPNWKQPYVNIAEVYLNWLSNLDSADTWMARAYALDTASYFTLQEISWLRQYQHRPEEAKAICTKLISLRPDVPNAYFTMTHTLLLLQGRVAEAEAYRQKGKALADSRGAIGFLYFGTDPFCPATIFRKTRRQKEGIACIEALLGRQDLENDSRCYLHYQLAATHNQLLDLDRASEVFRQAERAGRGYFSNYVETEKGRMQLLQGHNSEAEKTLLHAITLNDSEDDCWITAWALLGSVKAAQGRPAEAETYFRKAVDFHGMNTANIYWEEAWFRYGEFLLAQSRGAEARRAFEKTEEIYPNGYFAPYGMALLEAKAGHKNAALDWLELSFDRFYPIPGPVVGEPLFSKIKKTKRFRALMEKHFPKEPRPKD